MIEECPYCHSPISSRANAKTCGDPDCAEEHRRNIARATRGTYNRRVRQDAAEMERKGTTAQLLAECRAELRARRAKRVRVRHHWTPYSGHVARRIELNKEKMRLWT